MAKTSPALLSEIFSQRWHSSFKSMSVLHFSSLASSVGTSSAFWKPIDCSLLVLVVDGRQVTEVDISRKKTAEIIMTGLCDWKKNKEIFDDKLSMKVSSSTLASQFINPECQQDFIWTLLPPVQLSWETMHSMVSWNAKSIQTSDKSDSCKMKKRRARQHDLSSRESLKQQTGLRAKSARSADESHKSALAITCFPFSTARTRETACNALNNQTNWTLRLAVVMRERQWTVLEPNH